MRHVTEEDLVLHHYGEAAAALGVGAHLEGCDRCQAEYAALRCILAAVDTAAVPERGAGYEREVWARLQPRLEQHPRRWWLDVLVLRRLAWAASLAVVLVAAFVAGRFWPRPLPVEQAAREGTGVRERVLLVAVSEHLDRTEMVLAELVNTRADGPVDVSQEQARATDLVLENRLYRQTAVSTGDQTVADALDELERVLLEIARGPSTLSAEELETFRRGLEAEGIVFKIRVLGAQVRERKEQAAPDARMPKV